MIQVTPGSEAPPIAPPWAHGTCERVEMAKSGDVLEMDRLGWAIARAMEGLEPYAQAAEAAS